METNVNSEPFKFKVGDKVKCVFFGDRVFTLGKADILDNLYLLELVGVSQPTFMEDGRYNPYHTHPVLTLVERPKKKVKKQRQYNAWVNVYPDGVGDRVHGSESSAKQFANEDRLTCVQVSGSYEFEVEE